MSARFLAVAASTLLVFGSQLAVPSVAAAGKGEGGRLAQRIANRVNVSKELLIQRLGLFGRRAPTRNATSPFPAEATYRGTTVRRAETRDLPRLTRVLAKAFDKDRFANWFCKQDKHRKRRIKTAYAQYLRTFMAHGEVFTTDKLDGAACWIRPSEWNPGRLESNVLALHDRLITGVKNYRSRKAFIEKLEAVHPKEDHWYFMVLGTDPAGQGRGVGSALMKHLMGSSKIPVILTTENPDNLPYYERRGFKVVKTVAEGKHTPPVWFMKHTPDA